MERAAIDFRPSKDFELDEVHVQATHVHIERMNTREFWIGVDAVNGISLHIRTGISKGRWYFSVEEDGGENRFDKIEKPACHRTHVTN